MNSGSHTWRVSGETRTVNISASESMQEQSIGAFTFRLVSGTNVTPIITSVRAVSNMSLNGTVLTCEDGGEPQETMIFVYGEVTRIRI